MIPNQEIFTISNLFSVGFDNWKLIIYVYGNEHGFDIANILILFMFIISFIKNIPKKKKIVVHFFFLKIKMFS